MYHHLLLLSLLSVILSLFSSTLMTIGKVDALCDMGSECGCRSRVSVHRPNCNKNEDIYWCSNNIKCIQSQCQGTVLLGSYDLCSRSQSYGLVMFQDEKSCGTELSSTTNNLMIFLGNKDGNILNQSLPIIISGYSEQGLFTVTSQLQSTTSYLPFIISKENDFISFKSYDNGKVFNLLPASPYCDVDVWHAIPIVKSQFGESLAVSSSYFHNGCQCQEISSLTSTPTKHPTISSNNNNTCTCDTVIGGSVRNDDIETSNNNIVNTCAVRIGRYNICYQSESPCTSILGIATISCYAGTSSPTAVTQYPTITTVTNRPTLRPSTTSPTPTPKNCMCRYYINGATPGQPLYCLQVIGVNKYCYTYQATCPIKNGMQTTVCSAPTRSPTKAPMYPSKSPTKVPTYPTKYPTTSPTRRTLSPTSISPTRNPIKTDSPTYPDYSKCACDSYQGGAVEWSEKYCYIFVGKAQFCFPYTVPCTLFFNQQTTSCIGKTKSPTKTPTIPTSSPTLPTSSPTRPTLSPTQPTNNPTQPTQSPTSSPTEPITCDCSYFMDNTSSILPNYCVQQVGTSKFCYPFNGSCREKNGLPTVKCNNTTRSPTLSPVVSPKCACTTYFGNAAAGQSSYCFRDVGSAQFCFPSQMKCEDQFGLSTSFCINLNTTISSSNP